MSYAPSIPLHDATHGLWDSNRITEEFGKVEAPKKGWFNKARVVAPRPMDDLRAFHSNSDVKVWTDNGSDDDKQARPDVEDKNPTSYLKRFSTSSIDALSFSTSSQMLHPFQRKQSNLKRETTGAVEDFVEALLSITDTRSLSYSSNSSSHNVLFVLFQQELKRLVSNYLSGTREWINANCHDICTRLAEKLLGHLPETYFVYQYDGPELKWAATSTPSVDKDVGILEASTDDASDYEIPHGYLVKDQTFWNLATQMESLFQHFYSDQLELIRYRILCALKRDSKTALDSDALEIVIDINLEISRFLTDQYEMGVAQPLGDILAFTGRAMNAQLATLKDYLQQTWPDNSFEVLEALQNAIHSPSHQCSHQGVIIALDKDEVRIHGSLHFVVTAAQQLAWLLSAFQVSDKRLAYCDVDFREKTTPETPCLNFRISCTERPIHTLEVRGCWNRLIGNSRIITGFPVAERHDGMEGLELPTDLMAELAGVPLVTRYAGGLLLKGPSMMVVPMKRKGNCIQWHLFLAKAGSLLRLRDVRDRFPGRLLLDKFNEKDLHIANAFLGWCSHSQNHIATQNIRYSCIGRSDLNRVSRKVVSWTGGTVGFNKLGITSTLTYSIAKKDSKYSAAQPRFYEDCLQRAEQIPIIFQDTEGRRAWQTDGQRAILHLLLHREGSKLEKANTGTSRLRFANKSNHGTVRDAMLHNEKIVISESQNLENADVKHKLFRDAVSEMLKILEDLRDQTSELAVAGIELNKLNSREVYGWEYVDLIQARAIMHPRQAKLRETSGKWAEYARGLEAVVVFGARFGEMIQPNDMTATCRHLSSSPEGYDYLCMEASTLHNFCNNSGKVVGTGNPGIHWAPTSQIFKPCPQYGKVCGDSCSCERIQQFTRCEKGFPDKNALDYLLGNRGALLFGQMPGSWVSRSLQDIKKKLRREEELTELPLSVDPASCDATEPGILRNNSHLSMEHVTKELGVAHERRQSPTSTTRSVRTEDHVRLRIANHEVAGVKDCRPVDGPGPSTGPVSDSAASGRDDGLAMTPLRYHNRSTSAPRQALATQSAWSVTCNGTVEIKEKPEPEQSSKSNGASRTYVFTGSPATQRRQTIGPGGNVTSEAVQPWVSSPGTASRSPPLRRKPRFAEGTAIGD